MWGAALAKNPQPYAVKIDGREVVAGDITAIPPTCLDTLRFAQEAQGASAPWQTVALG
jgi:hypothetical protein